MRILVAEDEKPLARAISKIFEKSNYSTDVVFNGEDALDYIETGNYDAAVLDVMMPKLDGISVLKKVRQAGNNIPILILTAKSETDDKVLGLDSGANDYLTKPFDSKELTARIRAITRTQVSSDTKLTAGNLTLDRATFELASPEGSFKLANKEFQMMEMFMMNRHVVISTEKFMEKIWGYDSESEINVVWVYISYLRKKLTALKANVFIKASRNAGYSLEETDD
ncbi:MAG: response regulator transcription factor [Clostridia bacterium]|nr:response regulator transcription factor [Clostridia bacterium]